MTDGNLRQKAEEYLEALRLKGCRRTEQRRLIIEALLESGFNVQSHREKVESVISEPFFVDGSGVVKRRA